MSDLTLTALGLGIGGLAAAVAVRALYRGPAARAARLAAGAAAALGGGFLVLLSLEA